MRDGIVTDAHAVARARRWFRCLGQTPVEHGAVTVIATPEHPDVWDANFAMAGTGATSADLFTALDKMFERAAPRMVIADLLTPPEVEAALPLAKFAQRQQAVEMIARGPVVSPRPLAAVELRRVDDAASWAAYAELVRADHREGDRTGAIDDVVSAGLLDLMRRRPPPCDNWLLVEDGEPVGYGSTAASPGGLGLIENLFTRPDRRARGLMSAFIVVAAEQLRRVGCTGVFLDAHADAAPQQLYAALSFAPVALTRTWAQNIAVPS